MPPETSFLMYGDLMASLKELPVAPTPVGAYEAGVIRNGIGFVSGQFPLQDGKLAYKGKVGLDLTREEGFAATEIAARNVLAQIHRLTDGFEQLEGLLRLEGYVASAPGFVEQPEVLDAASDVFKEHLGEKGRHARTAFSVSELPLNSPVELCVSFAVKSNESE